MRLSLSLTLVLVLSVCASALLGASDPAELQRRLNDLEVHTTKLISDSRYSPDVKAKIREDLLKSWIPIREEARQLHRETGRRGVADVGSTALARDYFANDTPIFARE